MVKWIAVALGVLVGFVAIVILYALATGLRTVHPVAFQMVSVPDPHGRPVSVGLWYPSRGTRMPSLAGFNVQFVVNNGAVEGEHLPLVVISHGNGGGIASHLDTALALADAGFIVAAPMHTGDNFADQSAVGGPEWFTSRPRHISAAIDYVLKAWSGHDHVDGARIGMFGFSAGGFTALISIGGQPDLASIAGHCASAPEFACQLWKPGNAPLPPPAAFVGDPRIRAAVIAAPGFGFAFVPQGLANIHVPVQLWSGEADTSVPTATNAGPVRDALGPYAEFHSVPGAGHFSFLVPCGLIGPPLLCHDAQGFDRKAFHKTFDAGLAAFFAAKLTGPN